MQLDPYRIRGLENFGHGKGGGVIQTMQEIVESGYLRMAYELQSGLKSLDGKIFPMKDYQAGITATPFHVNCRSTAVSYFDDDLGQSGEGTARDEETGGNLLRSGGYALQ